MSGLQVARVVALVTDMTLLVVAFDIVGTPATLSDAGCRSHSERDGSAGFAGREAVLRIAAMDREQTVTREDLLVTLLFVLSVVLLVACA